MTGVASRRRAGRAVGRAEYENQLEAFWAAREEALYRHVSGLSPDLDLEAIYAEHAALFDRASVDRLQDAADRAPDEGHRARHLLAFATDGYIERAVASVTDAIASAEASAVVMWRGQRLPYRGVRGRLSEMSNRSERYVLFEALTAADDAINPMRRHRLDRVRELTSELGYADYLDLIRVTRGYDPDALVATARDLLSASETMYYGALRRHLARIEIEQGDARLPDLWYLLRGIGWDHWFAANGVMGAVEDTLAGMGMRLADQSGITVDLDDRPAKSLRPLTAAVRVPTDVRLAVQPQGGWDDYAATFHEVGHAAHLLAVEPGLSPAARLLGDRGLAEGYAQAFERIPGHPSWLGGQLRMTDDGAASFADFFAFLWLHHVRRTAALVLAQVRLHRGGQEAVDRAEYAGLVGLLTGVTEPEARYLLAVDDGLGAADYLRGIMVDGCLTDDLASRHGPTWWHSPEAGDELRDLWRRGLGPSAEDAVASLGYDHVDWRPVLRQIRAQLIGEMSGYGGPNITTRAGSRKV